MKNELLVINILTFLLIGTIALFPLEVLRIILGLPLILFFPGYTFIAALFPKKGEIGNAARLAFSLGLSSIAIASLMGLALYHSPWGIGLYPILFSFAGFILITSVIALLRCRNLPIEERFTIRSVFSQLPPLKGSKLDKALSIILVVAILGVVGTMTYVIFNPKVGQIFTEFYILGSEGMAENYSVTLELGKSAEMVLGVINREHEEASYWIEARIEGEKVKLWRDMKEYEQIGPIRLSHEEKWEETLGFIPIEVGENQKLEFLLYREGRPEPYRLLDLRIQVIEVKK